jgi:hypothetical protein
MAKIRDFFGMTKFNFPSLYLEVLRVTALLRSHSIRERLYTSRSTHQL